MQGAARGIGDRLSGQVVGRGAEATGHHDALGSAHCVGEDIETCIHRVPHGGMEKDAEAEFAQFAAEPLAICVQPSTTGHFVANGDYFCDRGCGFHGVRPLRAAVGGECTG